VVAPFVVSTPLLFDTGFLVPALGDAVRSPRSRRRNACWEPKFLGEITAGHDPHELPQKARPAGELTVAEFLDRDHTNSSRPKGSRAPTRSRIVDLGATIWIGARVVIGIRDRIRDAGCGMRD
jgi:hypothetical protein